MRFIVDNALSPVVADVLRDAGHEAIHVRAIGMQRAPDADIFDRAADEERTVVSADTDFGTLLALRRQSKPSVVLFRLPAPRRPVEQARMLLDNLESIKDDLLAGSIVVIEPSRIRVRRLPFGRGE